jgi:hypothetical protein
MKSKKGLNFEVFQVSDIWIRDAQPESDLTELILVVLIIFLVR